MLMVLILDAHSHIYFYKHIIFSVIISNSHLKIYIQAHQPLLIFQEYLDSKSLRKKDQNMNKNHKNYKELPIMEKNN